MDQLGLEMNEEELKQIQGTEEQAPAPAPQPEAAAEPQATPPAEPPQQPEKVVPLAALIEERERIKEYKRQLKAYEDLRTQFEAYRNQQAAEKAQAQQPPVPAFDEDPLTHMKARLQQVDQVEQTQRLLIANQMREQQLRQVKMAMDGAESAFRKEHPDYDAAISHIANFRRQELADLGVTDPVQISQILAHNALGLWQQAAATGKNPPEVVYALAKRYGYKPSEIAPATPGTAVEAQQQIETQQQKDLKAIEAGQRAATNTLSGAGKTGNESTASIQALLDAEGADFDKMWKEMFKGAK